MKSAILETWKRYEKIGRAHDWRERPVLLMECVQGSGTLRFEGRILKSPSRPGWVGLEVWCDSVLVWEDSFDRKLD
jgi:hypothetical protein